jgi:hypothetical protein
MYDEKKRSIYGAAAVTPIDGSLQGPELISKADVKGAANNAQGAGGGAVANNGQVSGGGAAVVAATPMVAGAGNGATGAGNGAAVATTPVAAAPATGAASVSAPAVTNTSGANASGGNLRAANGLVAADGGITSPAAKVVGAPGDTVRLAGQRVNSVPTTVAEQKAGDDDSVPNDLAGWNAYFRRRAEEARSAVPSKEDLAKEKRRYRTNRIISSLTDTARGLANVIFTSKGAPSMYSQESAMAPAVEAKHKKFMDDYEAKMKEYNAYAMDAYNAQRAQDADEYKRQLDAQNYMLRADANARAQAAADREAKLADLKYELSINKITEAQYKAQKAQVEAEHKEALLDADERLKESQINKNNRWQPSGGKGKGGSKKQDYTETTEATKRDKYGQEYTATTTKTRHYGASGGSTPKKKGKAY